MKKKIVCMLSCLLILSCTGCGANSQLFGEKVTAQQLVENAFHDDDACVDMDLNLFIDSEINTSEMGIGIDGVESFSMRVVMDMNANMQANKLYGYMTGAASIAIGEEEIVQQQEVYYDYNEGIRYDYDTDTSTWVYQEYKPDNTLADSLKGMDASVFESLDMEKRGYKDDYVISGMIDYDDVGKVIGEDVDFSSALEDTGTDADNIPMNVRMVFDYQTQEIKEMSFSADMPEQDNVKINEFSISIIFNKVGGKMDIEIPRKVSIGAISVEEFNNIGQLDESRLQDLEYNNEEGNEGEGFPTGSDTFGSYNGAVFGTGFPLSTFTNDGWILTEEMEKRSSNDTLYLSYENDKYPKASLDLYGMTSSPDEEKLGLKGIYGYDLKVCYCKEGDVLPNATFSGLTWGASYEEVIEKYGEPKDVYHNDGKDGLISWDTLYYEAYDGTDVTFRISDGADGHIKGLSGVSVINISMMDKTE